MRRQTMVGLVVWGLSAAVTSTYAQSIDVNNRAFVPTGAPTTTPIGFYEFCRSAHEECQVTGQFVGAVILTPVLWRQLLAANILVNATVTPRSDLDLYGMAEYWTYPKGAGDCEDFVLAKRKALLTTGWSSSTLLIAVVRQRSGEGHAVLLVRTDGGDLVLDNLDGDVHVWDETPYTYLKRQSQTDVSRWIGIEDDRINVVTSAH